MSNLKKLAEDIAKLDDGLSACMKCGTCQSVCPIFAETMKESDVARGKLALLSNLSKSIATDAKGVRERLDRCLLCGSCQAACPSGVKILDIFMKAREISAITMGLNPIKKLIFRMMLCHPKLFAFLTEFSAPFRKIFMRPQKNAPDTCRAILAEVVIGDRRLPVMPSQTIRQKYGNYSSADKGSGLNVLFFPGCMGDKVYTNVTEACLKIFKHHGVGVVMPANMACCGIPALASGDTQSLVKLAKINLDIFKNQKFDYIITACASCTETIAKLWAEYTDGEYKNLAEKFGAKTLDISAFLVDVLGVKASEIAQNAETITYHDSCHLSKALGIKTQPREILKASGVKLVEMPEADRCCGCGGSFTLTHYDLSRKIGQRKRDNILATGAKTVSAGCPACMMQISNMLALNEDEVAVKHVVEIYANTLPND